MAGAVDIRRGALAAAAVVAGLVILLFAAFYKNIILRIKRLSDGADALSKGDYSATIPVGSNDEIGALSESFNAMAAKIKATNRDIRNSEARYRAMLQTARDAIVTIDGNEVITGFNATAETLFGYGSGEVLGKNVEILIPERHRERRREGAAKIKRSEMSAFGGKTREYEALRKDGTELPVSLTISQAEVEGNTTFLAIIRDITEFKKAEEALRASERFMKTAQQIAHLGSWDWDIVNNTLVWSDEVYRIFGLRKDFFGATYEAFLNSVHPEDRQSVIDAVNAALHERKQYSIDHRITLPDGTVRIVHEQGDVTFDASGSPVRMVGTVQDITERKLSEYELKKLSMAIEQSVNIVFITDVQGVIEYVNPVFEEVTGYKKEEALGKTPRILSSSEVPRQKYAELWSTILSGKTWRGVLKNRKKGGGFFWVNAAISPIRGEKGEITHFLSVQEDITEKMASEERIRYLASNDELTGLLNRTRFIDLLNDWIRVAESSGETGALCFIDIDEFKHLNDSFGHGVGDEFLRRMARLFKTVVEISYKKLPLHPEEKPLLSRLSGDEFAVFLPSADTATSLTVMEELRRAAESFRFSEHETSSSVSIGVALYPEHGASTGELLTRADAAVYRAKELGRNRCHLFRPEDRDLEKMRSRLTWRDKILKALKEDRFEPWFQPILDLSDDTIRLYEVLARMRDDDGAILLPGSFIDIAERFGLVGLIDRTIILKAMEVQAEMMSQGKDLSFSLNLSGKDLGDPDLLSFIQEKIRETGADPARIVFEITETAAISDLERAFKFIKALKEIGCRFALDDFGVGFTSFTYLREMQVDYIKIDGSFIKKLHENPDDQVFVKAITDVARGLKIKSVAEFVETGESLKLLREFRVEYAQGYFIGKPGPALATRLGHDLKNIKGGSAPARAINEDG
jgi:diguanylate cyclase (GGDEF)-like protein/PAS domain S-box-containing protein